MESGSAVVGKDEIKKYGIYVEEYVLSYLRRESDSLELSEIYFYGSRQAGGRKFYVYGAGREKGIAAFEGYEPLSELMCRLTQAGPVFLVREPGGECRVNGFQVFYDNNEAMQNYLLEWTGSAGKRRTEEKGVAQEMLSASAIVPKEQKKRMPHGAMSVQLCLILVILVAIVITSTDSYDKMGELNRSAQEVFFAIENQEAEAPTDIPVRDTTDEKGIVVERLEETLENVDSDAAADDRAQDTDFAGANDAGTGKADTANAVEEETGESILRSVQEPPDQIDRQNPAQEKAGTLQEETLSAETENQEEEETAQQNEEENEEALSRSITRYYEVEQGDTLYTISQKIYGDISRVGKICEVNQISDPDKIRSGQRIILP